MNSVKVKKLGDGYGIWIYSPDGDVAMTFLSTAEAERVANDLTGGVDPIPLLDRDKETAE